MADLAADNVTVTLLPQDVDLTGIKKITYPSIKFGNGALTIPAAGIPLPDKSKFGMKKEITRMLVIGSAGTGYVFEYDKANHKLLVFYADYDAVANGALIAATGVAPAELTLPLIVIGE